MTEGGLLRPAEEQPDLAFILVRILRHANQNLRVIAGRDRVLRIEADIANEDLRRAGRERAARDAHWVGGDVARFRRDQDLLSIRAPAENASAVRGERPGL